MADVIDQLDLAIDQLAINERNFDRFALMLVDNVIELTLHGHAQNISYENELWHKIEEPKHNPKSVQKALGQNFDLKVKFARKTDLIDSEKCESLLNLHSFRNTSYHRGQRHEGILHSLAHFYFLNACEILQEYSPMFWSSGSNDQISHRARKYLGKAHFMDHKKVFKDAFIRLHEVAINMDVNLIQDLTTDLEKTINSTDEDIKFLSDNDPNGYTRDEVIIESQAWSFAFTEEAKEFAEKNSCNDFKVGSFVDWIRDNYNWTIKSDPIPSWRKRLLALSKEANLHLGLKKYCDFMRQTEKLRSDITEATIQLDSHIQHQIDIARGK